MLNSHFAPERNPHRNSVDATFKISSLGRAFDRFSVFMVPHYNIHLSHLLTTHCKADGNSEIWLEPDPQDVMPSATQIRARSASGTRNANSASGTRNANSAVAAHLALSLIHI